MAVTFDWIWAVLLLPLVGFLVQAAFGKRQIDAFGIEKGRRICGALAVIPIALAFLIGVVICVKLGALDPEHRLHISTWFNWIDLQSLKVPFELRVDPLAMTMVMIITGVGALIHLYATGYMADEKDYPRFFTYLNLFIAFMLMLVLGNNLPLVFIGWEGVGLCSYLLIGFWYEDIANAKAANKAFIVNRIGDWGMALGMFLIYCVFAANTNLLPEGETRFLSFDVILPLAEQVLGGYGPMVVTAIPLLLFIGACGKSAQFPLYLWLPDAMAGPTPVSALIHAATMVTAGVYLVARTHIFFELSPFAMMVVACIGAFTAIFAASIAFGQMDIKKVLAYSTVSQLGYMFLACGVGAFGSGMFHVTTHAFFKALLFLGSGAVIMAMAHNQDMRNYGNLRKYLPITYFTMMMGWLAICGIPIWAGFFSKDEILGRVYLSAHYWQEQGWAVNPVILYGIGLVTALMTAAYMTRMFWLTFYSGEERWRKLEPEHHQDEHEVFPSVVGSPQAAVGASQSAVVPDGAVDHDEHGFFHSAVGGRQSPVVSPEEHHSLDARHEPREVGFAMWFPLAVLALLSLLGGAILAGFKPLTTLFHIDTTHLFEAWNAPSVEPRTFSHEIYHGTISTEWMLVLASVAAAVLGIVVVALRYRKSMPRHEVEFKSGLQRAAGAQWFFDGALYKLFVDLGGRFSAGLYRWFDKGVIDGIFVHGAAKLAGGFGLLFRKTQTGYARYYAMAMLAGVIAIMSYIIYATTSIDVVK
ncbi:MAG: NADH-quinone oxidoreductase subunit L [Fimbriimonadales bacterium]